MVDLELLEAIRQMIREETAPIKEDVGGIKSDLASVKGEVSSIKSDLAAVKDQVSGIESNLTAVKDDVSGTKVILEVEIRRDINLLVEGHEIILERLPDPAEAEALNNRVSAVETVVKKHSRDIQDLRKAQ